MSSFDDQVYNLKEAIWHKRGPRLRLPQDTLEFERGKKIADLQAAHAVIDHPPIRFADLIGIFATGAALLGIILLMLL